MRAEVDRDLREGRMGRRTMDDTSIQGEILLCATCGRALDGDSDEDPTGDAGRPICGECERERNFLAMDMLDGVEDGNWDPDR